MLSSAQRDAADWRAIGGAGAKTLAAVVRCEELEKFGWESGISIALVATGIKIENAIERPM